APGPGFELIHMHGELLKARHVRTGEVRDWPKDIPLESDLRPHIVWFGEMPLGMERIEAALGDCGLFVSIGTSGNVYPAAGFVELARRAGAHTVELNLEPSLGQDLFAERRYGPATELVPEFVDRLLAG
ncbi:MAG: Sir2 family NAD-dependent protein deacetylase, partial [Asticcacaulis sp.]